MTQLGKEFKQHLSFEGRRYLIMYHTQESQKDIF